MFENIEISACCPIHMIVHRNLVRISTNNREINNKSDNEMTKKGHQPIYMSPKLKTAEILVRRMLCQSGGINDMIRDEDEGELFS